MGEVLCFPTPTGKNKQKKKPCGFPTSPQYSKRSPKITQNAAALLLLPKCQPLWDKKDKGVQARPASSLPAVIPSIFLHAAWKHKWGQNNTRPHSFLPHTYQGACAMITKIAANSSSDLKYSCPIYLTNHLQEEARTCSFYPFFFFFLVLIYSVYLHNHRQEFK